MLWKVIFGLDAIRNGRGFKEAYPHWWGRLRAEGGGSWVRGGRVAGQMAGDKLRGTKDGLAASGTLCLAKIRERYRGVKCENPGGQAFFN